MIISVKTLSNKILFMIFCIVFSLSPISYAKKIEYEKKLRPILETAEKSILNAVVEFINWRINNRKQQNAIIHPMSYYVLEQLPEKNS